MPGFAIPHLTPPHQEIGQTPSIGQSPTIGQTTLDEQIQQASTKCVNGDQAACNQWIQLTSLKGQMTAAGNVQAGGTPIGDILNPSATTSPYSFGTSTTGTQQWAYPFDPKFFNAQYLTEKFGATSGEWGNDYGLPSGTPIYSPFEGTVVGVENNGNSAWGTRIFVQGPDGTIFAVGHVRQGSTIGIGTKVKPGQQIALSGGGANDPGHGNSTGPHVEIQVIKPGGNIYNRADYINSQPWLQNIFSGTPSALGMPDGYYTIDGHFIENGSPDDVIYKMAQSIWHKEYGTDPPYSIVQAMRLSGAKTIDDLQAMVNAMPSSIPGVNIGTYNGVNANLQKIGTASFGRPMSQALLKQFLADNITTPEQMQAYFDSHPASQIPQDTFQAIYDIANQTTQGVWNAPPTLDQVAAIAGSTNIPPPAPKPPVQNQQGEITGGHDTHGAR